jgi:hypothetical protein
MENQKKTVEFEIRFWLNINRRKSGKKVGRVNPDETNNRKKRNDVILGRHTHTRKV